MGNINVQNFGYNTGTFQTTPAVRPPNKNQVMCKRCKKEICSCPHGCRCKNPQR